MSRETTVISGKGTCFCSGHNNSYQATLADRDRFEFAYKIIYVRVKQ